LSKRKERISNAYAIDVYDGPFYRVVRKNTYKTNYSPAVCNILHQEGAGAEVVSAFELLLAKKPWSSVIKNIDAISLPLTSLH